MRIPAKMLITIKVGDRPTKGMFVILKFLMARKNSYNLVFGPSDEQGRVEATRDEIIKDARKSMELFLMDYGEIKTYWTGQLQVTPMNRESIGRALSAIRLFRDVYEYPHGHEELLRAADAALAQMGDAELTTVVQTETDESIAVETVSVRAT